MAVSFLLNNVLGPAVGNIGISSDNTVHGRPEGTARKRFNDNRQHFIEGEDFFVRISDEAKKEYGVIAPNGLVLMTEQGYLMLVKSFTDDLALAHICKDFVRRIS